MSSSKIGIMKAGANNILIPRDMLTFKNCDDLEHVFDALVKQKSGIVLDCKSVSLMDSKALELLLRMHDAMKSRGRKLKICGLNKVCWDILLATRLINVFNVYRDVQEAVRSEA